MKLSSPQDIKAKRDKEKEVLSLMIEIYCKGNKHNGGNICKSCQRLMDYSNKRVDLCPFMETKTFCQSCQVHCFEETMRAKIKEVMKYSGPRMIFYHPLITLKHGIDMWKSRIKKNGQIK